MKKIFRFITVCPVFLFSHQVRSYLAEVFEKLFALAGAYPKTAFCIMLFAFWCLLLYRRSAALYAYDERQEKIFLGRVFTACGYDAGRGIMVYLPGYLLKKSDTGRFFLHFAGRRKRRPEEEELWILTRKGNINCRASHTLELTLYQFMD